MNSVVLIGRLTRDVELRFTNTNKAVANFTLAVDRTFNKDEVDFFSIQVWGKNAENVANYLSKGSQAAIRGRIQNRSYEKDGQKKYITEIVADEVQFLSNNKSEGAKKQDEVEFRMLDDDNSELPF